MDYNNLKTKDFIYLSNAGISFDGSTIQNTITFKDIHERFCIEDNNSEIKHTFALANDVPTVFIGIGTYSIFLLLLPQILGYSTLALMIAPIISFTLFYFASIFSRYVCGIKKVDISKCKKISVEEIKEKYLKSIWIEIIFNILNSLVLTILFSMVAFVRNDANILSNPITIYFISDALGFGLYCLRFADIFSRYKSMKQIEKEYKELKKDL